jgi:LmbE family N-acetylglucosaminyl deacetylase
MKILAIGAHQDDPDIGCGGSLILHADAGDDVTIVYATDGAAGSAEIPKDQLAPLRRAEAEHSAAVLGAKRLIFLPFSDGQLAYAGYDLVTKLGRIVRSERPEIVYTHHPGDAHPDHRALATATLDACRRASTPYFQEMGEGRHTVTEIRLYEVWTPLQEYRRAIDVSAAIDRKTEAIRQHRTQLALIPYDEVARGLARYRSIAVRGSTYAEVFDTARATW